MPGRPENLRPAEPWEHARAQARCAQRTPDSADSSGAPEVRSSPIRPARARPDARPARLPRPDTAFWLGVYATAVATATALLTLAAETFLKVRARKAYAVP